MARLKVEDSKVIEVYNTQGKAAAIETIHATYGVKDAYYVLRRLKATESYAYDSKRDLFCKKAEMPFLALDELCIESCKNSIDKDVDCRPAVQIESKFDSYVQELVKERFMEYARFIQANSVDRIWRINKTALKLAGYQLELY